MTEITQQKGSSSSTPSAIGRWFLSKVMNRISSESRLSALRAKREIKRQKERRPHVVEYFHQVDDGYSHLAIQLLAQLKERYDIELIVHLVPAPSDDNFPEPVLWREMSRRDASNIAPYYDLEFASSELLPEQSLSSIANAVMANFNTEQFCTIGVEASAHLWRNDEPALMALAKKYGAASKQTTEAKLTKGKERRAALKHYGSAMFYYEGEWYWGVDRLYHLEERLASLGADSLSHQRPIAPRPQILSEFGTEAHKLTLEFFVSLRSPYTAVAWDPTIKLAEDSGVNLVVRPVLPMVMRGVPAPREKKIYIAIDAAREARSLGVDYGNFYDPIGKPVVHGYSLYMWAEKQNKGNEFLAAFLKAAFARGINTNSSNGLRKVVENAGLDWDEAKAHLDDDSWEAPLENNRLSMYEFGSWGVPSYRLLDAKGNEILSAWGQDRLWLVAQKISDLSQDS
ncbi:MAG: DsbA family protein [Marinobacter adhaerens]